MKARPAGSSFGDGRTRGPGGGLSRRGRARHRIGTFALLALLTLAGCADDDGPEPMSIEETDFAESLDIDLDAMTRLPSGVYIQTLEPGEGEETVDGGDVIDVGTKGWLSNGVLFSDMRDRFSMITDGPVGFAIGLEGMRLGEVRRIIVPWELGFGDQGIGDTIPPFSNLVFEVELFEVL